jgi:hypothetical protein
MERPIVDENYEKAPNYPDSYSLIIAHGRQDIFLDGG